MDLLTIAQIANPILQLIFIVVIGLGYYFSVRSTQRLVQEMTEEHQAGGGRPLITVSEDYGTLPNLNIIVTNTGGGPAKNISFEFSDQIVSSDGFVLSDLPYFQEGLPSLAAGASIACYWDTLENLLPLIKEGNIASDITVTVRYQDLNQRAYEHQWEVSARLYEGVRIVDYQGMTNLVDVVEQIRDEGVGNTKGQ
jgi:hypothetical protein